MLIVGQSVLLYFCSGNIGSVFAIDRTLGIISVVQPLDLMTQSRYELTVSAIDRGTPPMSNSTTVVIQVCTPEINEAGLP